jgi:nucleotide-binding universal stress UspA family protein
VMGSRGHGGLKAFLIGSVTQKVLAQTKLPVIVAR